MAKPTRTQETYNGFEQGPIRPPSEAYSLLIRITRNCPWNRCSFCPVYKGAKFSVRPVDHVKKDIDAVQSHVGRILENASADTDFQGVGVSPPLNEGIEDTRALNAARQWAAGGMKSIFLQDANSLIIPPGDLIEILDHLKLRFPWVERITSYARSHTIARISDGNLAAMAQAGLNRIHIGLESGSDKVLRQVRKGVTKAAQIKAGQKVKRAGMELSEYIMPGLGGRDLSHEHATETADALNRIDPDFIRLRTLAIPNGLPLYEDYRSGRFEKITDIEAAREILTFITQLNGITSMVVSDHILNLFEEVKGKLPEEKPKMVAVLERFLALDSNEQCLYQVGRRLGIFSRLDDLKSRRRRSRAEDACRKFGITPQNVDGVIEQVMARFI